MKKIFTSVLPDEPYKTSTKKNITVECTYDGPRYIILRFRQADGSYVCIDKEGDDLEQVQGQLIDQHKLDPEGVYQVILDAETHTWEAAYVTGYYSHEAFADYEETLPTGEKWTYHYDDTSCAVEQPFYVNDLVHNKETGQYQRPRYRVHAVAKKDFWNGLLTQIESYESILGGNRQGITEEQVKKIEEHLKFLNTCEAKYKDVDHWKIPFPPLTL